MDQHIIVACALLILGLAPRVSGMAISMDEQAELRVMAAIQNTSQCYGNYFYQQLCFGDTTIEITDAVYGMSPCNASSTHCCPDPGDCTIPVEANDPVDPSDYYNDILIKCNNKQTCDGLRAQWINHLYEWCTGVSGTSDYVTLYYMCLTEADRLTTTPTATTDVTISANSTTTSKPSPATQPIVIIAVIVVVVVAVVVAVTVWLVCRKRKADNRSEENKTAAAQSPPGMMTSHVSACVDDVDPYHTARPGGGPGPQGPPPAQGLNDVTKPATNPYDTGPPLTKPMVTKKPKPNPKAVDKPNIGADLYTEVVKVRPRKNVVLDKSPGEEDVEANNNGSDMTEAGDRASYDLVMQENHEYRTRQGLGGDEEGEEHGVDGEGEGEEHGVHAERLPYEGRQDGDQDIPIDPDYDLVMTEHNVYN